MNIFKKYLYIIIGIIAFILGVIGVIIPILPTTPFLLLTSFCFVRGSERFDIWFKSTSIYKNNLKEFDINRSMTNKQKVNILTFVNGMLLIPIILLDNIHIRLFLICIGMYKTYYLIFKVKTVEK